MRAIVEGQRRLLAHLHLGAAGEPAPEPSGAVAAGAVAAGTAVDGDTYASPAEEGAQAGCPIRDMLHKGHNTPAEFKRLKSMEHLHDMKAAHPDGVPDPDDGCREQKQGQEQARAPAVAEGGSPSAEDSLGTHTAY
jgi:hypothetical protein